MSVHSPPSTHPWSPTLVGGGVWTEEDRNRNLPYLSPVPTLPLLQEPSGKTRPVRVPGRTGGTRGLPLRSPRVRTPCTRAHDPLGSPLRLTPAGRHEDVVPAPNIHTHPRWVDHQHMVPLHAPSEEPERLQRLTQDEPRAVSRPPVLDYHDQVRVTEGGVHEVPVPERYPISPSLRW